jgi:7-cyano-7-deazaguanine synthase
MKAAIIYSGGMDSQTLLHEYKREVKLALSFNYGSNHNDREYEMAQKNTMNVGIEHHRIDLQESFKQIKSTLLSGADAVPEGHYAGENMKQTVVPFRNGIMLSIAAGIAASKGLDTVLIGVHGGDHDIYPDCRTDFITQFNFALKEGLWETVKVYAPYLLLDKKGIAHIGYEIGVPYALSYSCYKGRELHCGKCGSCNERKYALEGFDPTKYEETL